MDAPTFAPQFDFHSVADKPGTQPVDSRVYLISPAKGALPDSSHTPSACQDGRANQTIPRRIRFELCLPEISSRRWCRGITASFVTMPEASMHEDRRTVPRQHQIGSALHLSGMKSETETAGVQFSSKQQFRLGVPAPYPRHHAGPCLLIHDIGHLHPGL